ncbi:SCO family protein [Rubrivirga litoralis]|uniref:SCO family protein n=1 Tax=Rubrivirga litoralis TaxID=3075598 RepID=A0ABU3BTU7_9BACT|nr:SCO family protein [Rubrivirga sp. F394]MDT0632715.1 SCO family protein [Rubrivirga sp. F394]
MTVRLPALVTLALLLAACGGRPDHLAPEDDLSDASWSLVDQDADAFAFPDDLAGRPAYVTAVYTHCPDVCLATMQQTKRVREALGADAAAVRFVTLTFDPERDRPAVLRQYADVWDLSDDWTLATGDPDEVDRLMERLGVRVRVSRSDTLESGAVATLLDHSDLSLLLDADGRVVETYGGSAAPPEMVAEDARALL